MAGTTESIRRSTSPVSGGGATFLSGRERQLQARFRTSMLPTAIPYAYGNIPREVRAGNPATGSVSRGISGYLAQKAAVSLTSYGLGSLGSASLSGASGAIAQQTASKLAATGAAKSGLSKLVGGKAFGPVATAISTFALTDGSMSDRAANAAAATAGAVIGQALIPIPYVGAAIGSTLASAGLGKLMGGGHHVFNIRGIKLPENAPQILKDQGIEKEPRTISRYRYFDTAWHETIDPMTRAGDLTQQRVAALSRIFPGMRNIGKELADSRADMLKVASSTSHAMSKAQNYSNALYKTEGFIEELFGDKTAQGYIKRKTNMPFEEFEKGFKFASDKVITQNIHLPAAQKALDTAWGKANRGTQRRNKGSGWKGTTPYEQMVQGNMGGVYKEMTSGGGRARNKKTIGYQKLIKKGGRGRRPQYGPMINTGVYNTMLTAAQDKARTTIRGPGEATIKKHQDFISSTPEFGSYTQFRPFQPNWTPGQAQLGLPADAPGPDIDSLKNRLTITEDGYYGGMAGGFNTQFRYRGPSPRQSQRGMARQG